MSLFKFLTVVVKDDERAFLTRDGRFERLLGPGRFSAYDPGNRLKAEVVKVVRTELATGRALLLEKGIKVTGAGKNLAEAREPAIVERRCPSGPEFSIIVPIPVALWLLMRLSPGPIGPTVRSRTPATSFGLALSLSG